MFSILKPVGVLILALGLMACGNGGGSFVPAASSDAEATSESAFKYSLADGPDICFRLVREELGGEANVSTITSNFGVGTIQSDGETAGALTKCSVDYQDPSNPERLLDMEINTRTGKFERPREVEIQVIGSSSDFSLDDYLVPLGRIDVSGLKGFIQEQESELTKIYAKHALSSVDLLDPNFQSSEHRINVEVTGLFKANELENIGDAYLSLDGKKVIENELTK